jgi:hypothetical protein
VLRSVLDAVSRAWGRRRSDAAVVANVAAHGVAGAAAPRDGVSHEGLAEFARILKQTTTICFLF